MESAPPGRFETPEEDPDPTGHPGTLEDDPLAQFVGPSGESDPRPNRGPSEGQTNETVVTAELTDSPSRSLCCLQIITFLPFVIVIALASSIGSSFLDDATRTGYVALAMLPFVVGLSVKSWGLGTILQQGYAGELARWSFCFVRMQSELTLPLGLAAINWLHRWMGRLLWLVVTIHVIAYMTAFGKDGTLADEMKRRVSVRRPIDPISVGLS